MAYYYGPKRQWMAKKDAYALMVSDTKVNLYDKDAIHCYGMSKMTVIDEKSQSKKYEKVEFSEFCEYIARVADLKYKQEKDISLKQKIDLILDDILELVGYERIEVGAAEEEVSASDSDY